MLYLTLPLAGGLFYLIERMHPSGTMRSLLQVVALLIVAGYVEVWHLANTVALLHHPLTGNHSKPIYYVREVEDSPRAGPGTHIQARFIVDSYSDLFSAPVQVGEEFHPSWSCDVQTRASQCRTV